MNTTRCMMALLLLVTGACVGTIGGGETDTQVADPRTLSERIVIDSLTLRGSTDDPAAVVIEGVADDDGHDDTSWRATFQLRDCDEPRCLPGDGPRSRTHRLSLSSKNAEGEEQYRRVAVTLHR